MNVLFTCAGRRSYSITIFKQAAHGNGQVFACDASAEAPALRHADKSFVVPCVDDAGYIDELLKICGEHRVGLLIPALEPELALLSAHRARFLAVGTMPLVSSPDIVATCYDKLATARFLESCGVAVPRTYLSLDAAREALARGEVTFPLVIKPRWGVSSIGTAFPEDDEELELSFKLARKQIMRTMLADISATDPDRCILIQEQMPGVEYGLDVINDLEGRYVCTFAKRKLRMWAGSTDRAVTVRDERLEQLGRVIGEHLRHVGILDCDVCVSEKGCCPVDLNPRLGGGYPFSHLAGANLPAALLAWAKRETTDPKWFQITPGIVGAKGDDYVVMSNGNSSRKPAAASHCEVAILGAGPYGLAAAAHLRDAKIETCVFGKAMEFWENQMPKGMLLRSSWEASHIADPTRALTLDHFHTRLSKPIPLDGFINYGRWFQRQVVPDLDHRRIAIIEKNANGFRLALEDGEVLHAKRVVVAAGIAPFASQPAQFDGLPRELVSHTVEHANLGRLARKRVAVIGGGQSALESAALLAEAGAEVEVIVRGGVHWLDQHVAWLKSDTNPLKPIIYPPTDVGPPGLNWIVATPGLFRRLPLPLQEEIAYRSIRPAGAGWLVKRVAGVRITTGRAVTTASAAGDQVKLKLDDGSERCVDHVLIATGFRVDVAKYPFLAPGLLESVRVTNGYPELTAGFESSLPGLHFLGAPAARSFGPVCRFVCGTTYTARALARQVAGKRVSHF
ncbi:MAG: FAD-dependent oxidoreductase [Bryobacteraceae bacterium]